MFHVKECSMLFDNIVGTSEGVSCERMFNVI